MLIVSTRAKTAMVSVYFGSNVVWLFLRCGPATFVPATGDDEVPFYFGHFCLKEKRGKEASKEKRENGAKSE